MFAIRSRKEAALAALYARMPRDELEAKLRDGALVPQARAMARAELQRRGAAEAADAKPVPVPADAGARDRDSRQGVLVAAAFMAGLLAVLWFVLPTGTFFLALALFIPTVLAPLGKLFPTWGKVLSALLFVAPVGFGLWLWRRGDLAWQGGTSGPWVP